MRKLKLSEIVAGLAILASIVGITKPTNAFTLTTFSDREAWESEIEDDFSEENFNSITEDTTFNGRILDIGDFTLNGIGSRQKIDVPAFDVPTFSVDGTPMILGQTDSLSSFVIRFDFPITAFGADFDDITTQGATKLNADSNAAGTIPLNAQFFGFVADESFISLTFSSSNGDFDGFGLDNFAYVPSNEPPLYSSPTRSRTIDSDVVNPFVPVEFSPTQSIPLTFDDVQNVPFNFSPTIGLIGVGGMWIISFFFKRFSKR